MKKLNKLFAILIAVLGVQALSAQTDVTNQYLTNAGFESVNGWTIEVDHVGETYGGTYYKLDTGTDPNTIEVYHTWAGSSAPLNQTKNFKFSQKVTLPAGEYRLRVNGFYREGNQKNATTEKAWAFAGENKQNLVGIGNCGANNMSDAANVFKNGGCLNEFDFTITEEKQIEIGFQGYINTSLSWVILGPVSLLQYSMDDFNAELNAARTKLQNVTGLNTAMRNKVSAMLAETANVTQTKVAILEATAKVNNLYNEAMEMQTAIAEANAAISACESMLTNSTADDKTAFSEAISTAKTMLDGAADIATVKSVLPPLNEAKNAYCLVAAPAEGYPFDMTHLVVNPKFDEGTTGWTHNTGAPNWGIATNQGGAITGNFFENWKWESYTGDIYQELKGLPKGKYRLTAAAFRDQLITVDNVEVPHEDAVYVFANDAETLVDAATPAFYSVEVSTTTGTLRIGVRSKVAKYRWMGIDNVTLKYVEALDLSEFIAAYNTALEEAKAARDNAEYTNIAGVERAALLNAIENTPEETQESLADATAALQSATAVFTAAKYSYDLLAIEKQIAKGLGMTDAQIAEIIDEKTGAEALPALRVAEYNYVTDEFSYPVELEASAWVSEGPTGSKDEQHWSGESSSYLEQSGEAWGWDAWTISYKQDLTLPSGDYVFKVAGRRASGTGNTLSLVVTNINNLDNTVELGTVNDFPEGDTGLGINKNGVTSFDANDEAGFANNNAGRGWQWRYVKFTLSSETKVRIAVNAEATTNYQWVGFCDAALQMTEETYLEANKHGLDAPTADAQALVDTKPMGTNVNEALQAALNMSYTTGAELKAKIDALNTAVANANAWVAAYNEAKAPLVAALERFEADYNKDGVKMSKSDWENVLDKVKAAAIAKDVTDSYDGFAAAAEELNAALDAAQASINAYAALNEAIVQAETLASANVGDQPFQKSEEAINGLGIADAKATYTAATADSEEVTSVTETLKAAINGIVLNAPAEGQRFHMVLTNNSGWEHDGKAVTYLAGGRNDAGLYNIQYYAAPNANYAQAFTFTAVEGQPDCYTLSMTDVDGNERYVSTGTVYGGNANQIRTTTDASKALAVKVIATATEGVWNLYNTAANNYIGGQDAGFFTVNSHINFNIVEAAKAEVTLTITDAEWSTLMLPFDAELPEGVVAYSCEEIAEDGVTLTLVEAESLKANTPYLVNGEAGKHEFAGYGLADKDSYTVGLFTGTYVDYQTTTNSYTYVLQKNDNNVAFYLVGEDAQPWVRAYRCYMTYDNAAGAPMFSISRGEDTTGIENSILNAQPSTVIYDLMGRKVTNMVKGNTYIVNGKKVIVK